MGDQKTNNLTYGEAMSALQNGFKIKLPEWTGYWFINDMGEVSVLTKSGDVLNTPWEGLIVESRNDWQIVNGVGFDWAVNALKNGKRVARRGWNGKGMFVFMRPGDVLEVGFIIDKVKSLPDSLKDYCKREDSKEMPSERGLTKIQFTPYLCMKAADGSIVNGWLASQTDILAEDWELAD